METIKKIKFVVSAVMLFVSFSACADFADEIKIVAPDGVAYDHFGGAVSISGDTAVIGAVNSSAAGAAYIFTRNPATGEWSQLQKLTASDSANGDKFGGGVAIDGDTLIVGAENARNGSPYTGAAYIFVKTGGVWAQQAKLLASDGITLDAFGNAVAIDGDTVVIGAVHAQKTGDTGITNPPGAAYVFTRNGTVWTEQARLNASDNNYGDKFGHAVAIDADTVVVGARTKNTAAADAGSAYIFIRLGTAWSQQQKLVASDATAYTCFGQAVAISGDMALISNDSFCSIGRGNSVTASTYAFSRNGTTWSEDQILKASSGASYDYFGSSISLQNNIALIGSQGSNDANGSLAGSAFIFGLDVVSGWSELQEISPSDGLGMAIFGGAVSIDGAQIIIGAWRDDIFDAGASGYITDMGSAYIYTQGAVALAPEISVMDSTAPNDDLQLVFGDVAELSSSNQTITITNEGTADLLIGAVAGTDAVSMPYTIETDNCSSQTLSPAANCQLILRFSPQSTGGFNDSFDIPSNDADESTITVSLTGTGIGTAVPDISVTDSIAPIDDLQIAFGNVTQATSSDQSVTISNIGNANLSIGNIATLDSVQSPFSILNDTCSSTTIAPAANCTLTVRFEPVGSGTFNDSFDIPSDDTDEAMITVNINGVGTSISVPDIAVTDSVDPVDDLQILFGNVAENSTATKQVTITNDGSADLLLGQIAQANTLIAPFTLINDACSAQTVIATATCSITIRFSPTSVADFNDSFDIPSNDVDENPITINVSGTGVVPNTVDVGGNPVSSSGGGSLTPFNLLAGLIALVLVCTRRPFSHD